jgi:hypothetical protein
MSKPHFIMPVEPLVTAELDAIHDLSWLCSSSDETLVSPASMRSA